MKLLFPIPSFLFLLTTLIMFTATPACALDLGLITPSSLAGETSWIILDGRPEKLYQQSHLPGALSFSWETLTTTDRDGVRYRVLPPDKLAAHLGRLGISETSAIVFYGDAESSWGGEGWGAWVMAWLGHRGPVRILAGGFPAWIKAGLPVDNENPKKSIPASYRVTIQPERDISVKQLREHGDQYTVIDVRTTLEWIRGHLPNAIHISWDKFHQGPERIPLNKEQLQKMLADHGIAFDKPIVYYCTGGIRSGYAWMVQELSGLGTAINFEGGIEAWDKSRSQN